MIVPYSHELHYEKLKGWLAHHKIVAPPKEFLPTIGYCCDDIAIGFLITTNSKRADIDQVAANPNVTPEKRDCALLRLLAELEERAHEGGFKILTVLATLETMKKRFGSLGYKPHGEYVLYYKAWL